MYIRMHVCMCAVCMYVCCVYVCVHVLWVYTRDETIQNLKVSMHCHHDTTIHCDT